MACISRELFTESLNLKKRVSNKTTDVGHILKNKTITKTNQLKTVFVKLSVMHIEIISKNINN